MRHNDIRTSFCHQLCLLRVEHIRRRHQIHLVSNPHHLNLSIIPHPRLLQILAEIPIDETDSREVLHAREPQVLELAQEAPHVSSWIRAADAGDDGRVLDDRQHVRGHLDHHVVGVRVRHEARERTSAVHPEAAAVVDDDERDAAGFGGFGREADACGDVFLVWSLGGGDYDIFLFEIDVPAPAPTMAVPESICFLKAARISLRSVGGAIFVNVLRGEVKSNGDHKLVRSL